MPNLDIKQLEGERASLHDKIMATVAEKFGDLSDADKEGEAVSVYEHFTGEEQTQFRRLLAAWKDAKDVEEIAHAKERAGDLEKAQASYIASTAVGREATARASAKFHQDLMAVGANEYRYEPKEGEHRPDWRAESPNTLELPDPVIAKGPDGRNRVIPIPAVYSNKGGKTSMADLEASYAHAERVAAGVARQYDPVTGNRLEAATGPVLTTDVPEAIPTQVLPLYEYAITLNKIPMYGTVYQTREANTVIRLPRRTGVPKAVIVGNLANAGQNQTIAEQVSDFSGIELKAWKYAFISAYAYETINTLQPWSIASQIVRDGAIGLANGFGEHVITGDGAAAPQGIITAINADANQKYTGVAQSTAFANANATFNWKSVMKFCTSLPIPYYESAELSLITNLVDWGNFVGVTDGDGRPLFRPSKNGDMISIPELGNMRVLLDQNIDQSTAAGKIPFIISDLSSFAVRYGGPARIDFSSEYKFANDGLAYRFIRHCDFRQVDPNATRGYVLA